MTGTVERSERGGAGANVRSPTPNVNPHLGRTSYVLPAGVALLAGLLAATIHQPAPTDSEVFWVATRDLVAGANPYLTLPARGADWPLYYPLPALLLLAPIAWLPLWAFRAVFVGVGAGLLALAGQRWGRGLPTVLLSAGFFEAVVEGQWSPYLTAGAVLPWVAVAWIAKPSLGLACFTGWPIRTRSAYICMLGLCLLSLAVLPHWPLDWLQSLRHPNHTAPVLRPYGWLLLLAWLRWRTPEGRLLGMLALVPHTSGLYETLPLWLIPQDRWRGYALVALSYVVAFLGPLMPHVAGPFGTSRWPLLLGCLYLPALALVLSRSRVNRPAA